MLPYLVALNLFMVALNLFIIVFGGGARRGGCLSGCLFWILVSVGITILINLILLLFSLSGPQPGGVDV